jgi:hypothetical protein
MTRTRGIVSTLGAIAVVGDRAPLVGHDRGQLGVKFHDLLLSQSTDMHPLAVVAFKALFHGRFTLGFT